MKPIIVTGGAGFIGSNIVAALNQRGIDNITIVDRLGSGEKWKNLRGLRYDNYLDKDEFITAIRTGDKPCKASAIIHMGACSATTERDADYLMRNNYQYTRDLCDWALQHEARFITASSAATYGDGALGYSDEDAVTPTLQPLNMYGYSKQLFDEWALRHNVYTRIVGLKFFNVFGPRETHKG
ncbi:MAG TPA: NAD-dependent epimerase/dehydratase family protein, partial [Myxococcota bacterium]|nr:NAD-dependent epimerase/dehydratase family protein [Myxococcota bacterium]